MCTGWGGSPCAGKSSIADILAATYGLSLYRADEAYFRHEKVVTPEQHPIFYKLRGHFLTLKMRSTM